MALFGKTSSSHRQVSWRLRRDYEMAKATKAMSAHDLPLPEVLPPAGVPLTFLRAGDERDATLPPIVVLHGFLGSARNWATVAPKLSAATGRGVEVLNLRNHGDSPQAQPVTFAAFEADLTRWLDMHRPGESVVLLGHSLGGKVALRYACHLPERVRALGMVDIAPRAYAPHYAEALAALLRLPLDDIQSRGDAENRLLEAIPDWALRRFLLTNLVRRPEGSYGWAIPLGLLADALPTLAQNSVSEVETYRGPTVYVTGSRSDFVTLGDAEAMARHTPHYDLRVIAEAGHNVHHDQPAAFVRAVADWLATLS